MSPYQVVSRCDSSLSQQHQRETTTSGWATSGCTPFIPDSVLNGNTSSALHDCSSGQQPIPTEARCELPVDLTHPSSASAKGAREMAGIATSPPSGYDIPKMENYDSVFQSRSPPPQKPDGLNELLDSIEGCEVERLLKDITEQTEAFSQAGINQNVGGVFYSPEPRCAPTPTPVRVPAPSPPVVDVYPTLSQSHEGRMAPRPYFPQQPRHQLNSQIHNTRTNWPQDWELQRWSHPQTQLSFPSQGPQSDYSSFPAALRPCNQLTSFSPCLQAIQHQSASAAFLPHPHNHPPSQKVSPEMTNFAGTNRPTWCHQLQENYAPRPGPPRARPPAVAPKFTNSEHAAAQGTHVLDAARFVQPTPYNAAQGAPVNGVCLKEMLLTPRNPFLGYAGTFPLN